MLTPREASIFACVCDTVVAPEPVLPPVRETDAVGFLDRWLAAAPRAEPDRPARPALRGRAGAAGARPAAGGCARCDEAERAAGAGAPRSAAQRPEVRALVKLVKGIAFLAYYGDDDVMGRLGYDADAVVTRGARAARAGGPAMSRDTGAGAYTDGTRHVRARARSGWSTARASRGERADRVDACVIGTGAGGAPVAKELAEGGMSVAMLEEGARFTADDLTARPREMTTLLYRDAGQITTVGNTPILLPLGPHGGRHDAGELGHLLPHARAGARAVARAVRPRGAHRARDRAVLPPGRADPERVAGAARAGRATTPPW